MNSADGKAMQELVNKALSRPKYKVLTNELLAQAADVDLVQLVVDNIYLKMRPDMRDEPEVVASLSPPQQVIYITYLVSAEVFNGGFNQFCYNSSGQYADTMPQAFDAVGAVQLAQLARLANDLYRSNEEQITAEQDGSLEGFARSYDDNPLESCDDDFYRLEKLEQLSQLQVAFIRRNSSAFVA